MAKAAAVTKTKTKIQVVSEILEKGITKASEIVQAAKDMGVDISEATAANYKHQLGKTNPRRKTRGRPPGTKVARVVRSNEGRVSTDLELENLALRLIIKCGSADKAHSIIDKLA